MGLHCFWRAHSGSLQMNTIGIALARDRIMATARALHLSKQKLLFRQKQSFLLLIYEYERKINLLRPGPAVDKPASLMFGEANLPGLSLQLHTMMNRLRVPIMISKRDSAVSVQRPREEFYFAGGSLCLPAPETGKCQCWLGREGRPV